MKMTPTQYQKRRSELSVLFEKCDHNEDICAEVLGDDITDDDYWVLRMIQADWDMRDR